MQFQIINVHDNMAPFLNPDGTVALFDDGTSAASMAVELTIKTGKKHQPRPIKTCGDAWKVRERARFESGEYRLPLFAERDWFKAKPDLADHFVHVSKDKPSMIAFTENAEQGNVDRQTRLRVGRYLQRFFPEIDGDTLRRECEMHAAAFEMNAVQFATTAEEIEEVYTNGPNSCMAYKREHFSCHDVAHPSAVYAGPDLAVAFMRVGDERVSARAVVWPSQKTFYVVYGTSQLEHRLIEMGYCRRSHTGARIQKIEFDNRFVCPYIDGNDAVHDDGDYLVIGRKSGALNLHCQNTDGGTGTFSTCACCGDAVDDDDARTVRVGRNDYEDWCGDCADNAIWVESSDEYACEDIVTTVADGTRVFEWVIDQSYFCSDRSGEYYHNDEATTVYVNVAGRLDEQTWSSDEAESYATLCDRSSEYYDADDTVQMSNGDVWGFDQFDKHGFECCHCGENFPSAEAHNHTDGQICDDCHENVEAEHQRTIDAINALLHPMLAAAMYSTLCLPKPQANS